MNLKPLNTECIKNCYNVTLGNQTKTRAPFYGFIRFSRHFIDNSDSFKFIFCAYRYISFLEGKIHDLFTSQGYY